VTISFTCTVRFYGVKHDSCVTAMHSSLTHESCYLMPYIRVRIARIAFDARVTDAMLIREVVVCRACDSLPH
jgi:hypothetical protein